MAKFTKAQREEYLDHLRRGMRPGAAAEHMGFERKAILDLIEEDEDLGAAVKDAEREATEHVEEALYQAAVSGNITAARIWLDLRKPKRPGTDLVPSSEPEFDKELAELNALMEGNDA